jgi:hypothetical protein
MENSDPGFCHMIVVEPGPWRPPWYTVKPESQGPIQGKNRPDLAIEVVRDASQRVTHDHTLDVNFRKFDFINKSNIQQQQEGEKERKKWDGKARIRKRILLWREGLGKPYGKVYEVDKRKKTKIVKESKQTSRTRNR